MTDLAQNPPESSTPARSATPPAAAPAVPPETLKSAFNAFKKRLKLTRLDHESRIGKGPMSGGGSSTIAAITPPNQFPTEVWEALCDQGKLKRAGHGMYALK